MWWDCRLRWSTACCRKQAGCSRTGERNQGGHGWWPGAANRREEQLLSHDFFSESCSPSFTADLKFLIPSPSPLPKSASLLGPKIKRATARISRISGKPNFPGTSCLRGDTRGALGRRLSLASKSRLVRGGSQRTVVGRQETSLVLGRWSLAKMSCPL